MMCFWNISSYKINQYIQSHAPTQNDCELELYQIAANKSSVSNKFLMPLAFTVACYAAILGRFRGNLCVAKLKNKSE